MPKGFTIHSMSDCNEAIIQGLKLHPPSLVNSLELSWSATYRCCRQPVTWCHMSRHHWHFPHWHSSPKLGTIVWVALKTPIERGSDAWFGGVHFFGPPRFGPLGFFWFSLLNLGPTTPNYSRKPPMRSSKAPTLSKKQGACFTPPCHPLPNLASEPRSMGVFRHFPIVCHGCTAKGD